MRRRRWKVFSRTPVLAFGLLFVSGAAAQTYQIERGSAPPQELAPAVRDVLAKEAVRVNGPEGPFAEIWLREGVPAKSNPTQSLGIVYSQLSEGTLLGAIRFPRGAQDYRRQRIKPGVYALRYALLPVDGNHMGVAPQRDFLLLVPAEADASPAPIPLAQLENLSRKASGTNHPSVWSLVPAEGGPEMVPSLVQQEEGESWVLRLRVQLRDESGAASALPMAVVIIGHAAEA